VSELDQHGRAAPTGDDAPSVGAPVLARLSKLDRFLPVWIVAAMAFGLVLGRVVPSFSDALDAVRVGSVGSWLITVGTFRR
jgi:ACR3 family arsenite transporter